MEAQPIIATEVVIEGAFTKDEEAEAVITIDFKAVKDHLTEACIEINTKAGITIAPLAVQTHRKVTRRPHHKECSRNPCFNPKCRFEHKTGQHRCKYRPCCRESCTMSHDLGQHCPDKN